MRKIIGSRPLTLESRKTGIKSSPRTSLFGYGINRDLAFSSFLIRQVLAILVEKTRRFRALLQRLSYNVSNGRTGVRMLPV